MSKRSQPKEDNMDQAAEEPASEVVSDPKSHQPFSDVNAPSAWQVPALSGEIDVSQWHSVAKTIAERNSELSPSEYAGLVISQITDRARAESELGRRHAVLMSVSQAEIEVPGGRRVIGELEPAWLKDGTAAKMVWQHVEQASSEYPSHCQPTLDYWDNVVGDDSGKEITEGGHNIIIRFEESSVRPEVPQDEYVQAVKNQIFERAEREIKVGRFFAILCSVSQAEIERPENEDITVCKPEWLTGSALEIFSYVQENGLKPSLERWIDPEAGEEGYNIVIHW